MITLRGLSAIFSACALMSCGVSAASAAVIPNAYLWDTSQPFFFGSGGADSRAAANTVNGGGNDGTNNDTNPRQMWLAPTATPASIEFALPRNFDVSDIRVWNYNETGVTGRGLNSVTIDVATSLGGSYSTVGTFAFPQASGLATYTGFDVSSLGGWSTQSNVAKIKFTPTTNHGGGGNWGLSEVRFITPSTLTTAPTPVATPITTVTVQGFSSEQPSFGGRLAVDTINGSGLTGSLHDNDASSMWQTPSADGGNPFITYDLNGAATGGQSLGRIQIWNWATGSQDIEASHIRLLVSPDNLVGNLVTVGEFQAFGRNASATATATSIPSFDLDFSSLTSSQLALLSNVELVRLQILSRVSSTTDFDNTAVGVAGVSRGVTGSTGFSEVRFYNQESPPPGVPEPSTLILATLGMAGLGLFACRKRRRG